MSATFKLYFLLVGLCVLACVLGYELYQGYGVMQSAKNNHNQGYEVATEKDLALYLDSNKAESIFVAMPIELPQSEVVIPQAREIELPKAKEATLPKQTLQKQGIVVIKGATSALIPSSSGAIK